MLDLSMTFPEKPFPGVIKIQEKINFNGIPKRAFQAVSRKKLAHVMLFQTAKI